MELLKEMELKDIDQELDLVAARNSEKKRPLDFDNFGLSKSALALRDYINGLSEGKQRELLALVNLGRAIRPKRQARSR